MSILHKLASLFSIKQVTKKLRDWNHLPAYLKNESLQLTNEYISKCSSHFWNNNARFQRRVVQQWNPFIHHLSDMFIFPLSLKDDLKQRKVGMIVLDMALSKGILVGPDGGPWERSPNWNELTVYVIGDFVSVRNLRASTKK